MDLLKRLLNWIKEDLLVSLGTVGLIDANPDVYKALSK